MFSYTRITINSQDEILLALIANDFPIESMEEVDEITHIYLKSELLNDVVKQSFENLFNEFGTKYSYEALQDQNWNEVWESNFTPVEVEDYCRIRAEFHDTDEGFEHEIIIQPKMAFGTGHHHTTYMMIKEMHGISFENKSVLDFGSGTGILAIYAAKLGAVDIDAVDIENESFLNTIENSERNGTPFINAIQGNIDDCPAKEYDVILANINRNILLDSVDQLKMRTKSGTLLLLSGILDADVPLINDCYIAKGFTKISSQQQGDWIQITFQLK